MSTNPDRYGQAYVTTNEAQTLINKTLIDPIIILNGAVWSGSSGSGSAMPSTTGTLSSVNASTSSVTLAAANAARLGLVITNDSSAILYVAYAASASSSLYTYKIEPSDVLEISDHVGIVTGIWASATGAARITERT